MAKVLFMQNCFVPDENQCNRLVRSLESLLAYSKLLNPTNTYYYVLAGFIEEQYKERISSIIDKFVEGNQEDRFFKEVRLMKFATNVGKGRVCNFAVDNFTKEFDVDYLFLFDNDIVFYLDQKDLVNILIEQMYEIDAISSMKYPVISCNFAEHQVHNIDAMDFGAQTKHGLIRCSTGHFGVLGGGAWLIKKDHWDDIGGYESNAIYGKEDGGLYLDTIRMKDRMVALSFDQYVIHPKDEDQTYNLFKADTNINRVRKMNYDELKIDSELFWNNRKG